MRPEPLKPEQYLYFQDNGIDIDACKIDYKMISVRCEDLSLYRKAFRVKIRSLIKIGDMLALKRYVDKFYALAYFVRYLYGFHSCASSVKAWQETLAYDLQKKFIVSKTPVYTSASWIEYKSAYDYKAFYKQAYKNLSFGDESEKLDCVQDEKPFLNPKDKAHFNKYLEVQEKE